MKKQTIYKNAVHITLCYNKLWKLLIDKSMTKTELRRKAGVTTNVIANLGKNESVQVEALYKICNVLNCTIDDISEVVLATKDIETPDKGTLIK